MKTFYSIIKLAPNNLSGDTVALGLILYNGNKLLYYFSDRKKRIASRLLDGKPVNIDGLIKQLKNSLDEINEKNEKIVDSELFVKEEKFFEVSYFDHLKRYSQGLIQFSAAYHVDDDIDDDKFGKLIELVFDEKIAEKEAIEPSGFSRSQKIVREKLIQPVKEKVHTFYKFSREKNPSIYFQYELDCIGLNGSLVGAKQLDFCKSHVTLDKSISHYFALISTLTSEYNKSLKENDFFLISDEPKKINSQEHQLWESIKRNSLIEVLDSEESGRVAELIFEKDAKTFLD